MINKEVFLEENILDASKLKAVPIRDGFGNGLVQAADKDERVVVLCADLAESTRAQWLQKKYPNRYIEVGIGEQNMATVAAGLANYGKIPFITSYATFSPGRNNEQIRTLAGISKLPFKIAGSHAGISVGPDGATHQALEDMALMRVIPGMIVLSPCDAVEAQKATYAAAFIDKPVYIRLAREKTPVFTTEQTPFEIGKANVLRDGKDVVIIACGAFVYNAILAADKLSKEGIECIVVNSHTVKPLDQETILGAAKHTGAVVSVEEHQVAGGLGSAVAELLAKNCPVPQEFIGVQDSFGQSGTPDELIEHYGMGVGHIVEAVKRVLTRKNNLNTK